MTRPSGPMPWWLAVLTASALADAVLSVGWGIYQLRGDSERIPYLTSPAVPVRQPLSAPPHFVTGAECEAR